MRSVGGLVVTADDFGLAAAVNEAVEIAHHDGILSAASLMVGGPAAADAVKRARRMPMLRVGLHLVLVDGSPILPVARIPDLVCADGTLRCDMVRLAIALATRSVVRRQLAEEIEAQFEAFRATGLALDHVNVHKHFHLHPVVAELVLTIGRRFGLNALRVPIEPMATLRQVDTEASSGRIEALMARRLAQKVDDIGVLRTDAVFGLRWSGAMTADRLLRLLRHLTVQPGGLVEIYTHPATCDDFAGHAPGYRYRDELAALCDPRCRELARGAFQAAGYADFMRAATPDPRPVTVSSRVSPT